MPDVRYMSGAPDPFDGAGMLQTQAKFQCNGGPDTISERAEAGACQVGNHIAWVRVAGQIVGLDAEIYPPAEYWHLLCHCPIGQGGSQELCPVPLTNNGVAFGQHGVRKTAPPFDARGLP